MYLLNTDEHKHENVVETRDRDSADSSKFNTDNLCILNTRSHTRKSVNWDNHHPNKHTCYFQAKFFCFAYFSFSGKKK